MGLDDVIWRLPEDIAAAVQRAVPGSDRWAGAVSAVWSFHEQRGDVCPPYWAERAAVAWRDDGCPGRPTRRPVCPGCGGWLVGSSCPDCDVVYGCSWWEDPDKRETLGLYARPWRRL